MFPIVFFDAIRVKIRDESFVRNKAVYIAVGILPDGNKEILGIWIEQTEAAKFWLKVMNELKTRGIADILIAVVDGLKGFPDAITAVFPQTIVQTCIVHLIRNSLDFVSWKDRKQMVLALKAIYRGKDADAGRDELHWLPKVQVRASSHATARVGQHDFDQRLELVLQTDGAVEGFDHP